MYAYNYAFCDGYLGRAVGNDSNWGDGGGSFQGGDTNKATSILNKGNNYEVQFFNGTGTQWSGGHICLSRNEGYASDLTNDYFTSGYRVSNAIKLAPLGQRRHLQQVGRLTAAPTPTRAGTPPTRWRPRTRVPERSCAKRLEWGGWDSNPRPAD